ncbi:uncharacterized protein LOC111394019 [Olea europaea var. sylvestris]|uniref:uncharacterized protein LOC111394019 n=1 Tax=Olea europaea var. sylvestris TaxID=158386 RepID=UPI000C1D4111|nr:uncharacterized protein LOC111394019 [Olea europaea var. sylvestris]
MDLVELIATTHSMFLSKKVVPPRAARIYELDSINQQESIKKLGILIGQIAQQLTKHPQETLPGKTMVNPKEQVQVIIIKSGVQLPEIHVKKPERKDKEVMVEEARKEVKSEPLTNEEDERKDTFTVKAPSPVKAYVPPIPFPQMLQRKKLDKQFTKYNSPNARLCKILERDLSDKRKLEEHGTVCLNEEYSASVNLMPLSIYRSIGLGEANPTTISLQLVDRSIKRPNGIIEDVLVKVDKFIFSADFIILDIDEDSNIPLILGKPFLAIERALIDVYDGKMILWVDNEQVIFNMLKAMKDPPT